jgi:signal transduction histidine kinase/CheY-like chemotaxis protein
MLGEFQSDMILLALPALYVGGIVLLASAPSLQEPLQGGVPAMLLFLLPLLVWAMRKGHYLASAWTLVLGCVAVIFLVVGWAHINAAIHLITLPVGLAALFVSIGGGSLLATICTLLVAFAPGGLAPDLASRVAVLTGMWGTVGLIWLTQGPLVTAMQWHRSSYLRNSALLEEARDSHVQLKQTLEDLADANLQLTRLNRLVAGLRQSAEEARRTKEEFVTNVSHELRTPLNMIIGFAELIMQGPHVYGTRLPRKLMADLDVILRNSRHLSRMIDDVLDLSQIEAGRVALAKECSSLRDVIQAATGAVSPLFNLRKLYLETEIAADLPPILCDPTRIRQVVLNLLSNAGRFTERGGVRVRAWQEGQSVIVSVADTGPGIASEALGRIFQPFQQLDGSIRRRYGGSGLGLSISKRFIELHDGRIWVDSTQGRGTTFYFSLPIEPSMTTEGSTSRWFNPYMEYVARTRPSMAPVPTIRPRFVVLEAGQVLSRLLSRYLTNAEIVSVDSLQIAIQELSQVPARALLVNDVSIAEGLRRIGEAGELPYGTPAVICCLPGSQEAVGGFVSDYLVKPVACDMLLAALDRLDLNGTRIMVVDDEPDAARLFQRMLLSSGRDYQVLRASNGQEALDMLREQQADALLLDLVMPGMDGFQFLAEKSQDAGLRQIPVVVISARDPAGQPIVSSGLAVTQGGGLSLPQMLECIEALSRILSTAGQVDDPASRARRSG